MTFRSNALARLSSRHLLIALTAALAVVSAVYLLRPIKDPDFFWHLKTGEWIWEHQRLPESDPFSSTGAGITTVSARFILTSYWGSQLMFHLVHALGGMTGIVLLRLLIWAALLAVVWSRREGDSVVDAALLLVFAVAFLERYPVERPQVLSFLGFGLLLHLLDGLKQAPENRPSAIRGRRDPILVALLMLVWGNLHGGVALGQATIVVYLAAEAAKFAHGSLRPIGRQAYRALLVAGVAGLAASLLNPNSYHALGVAFSAGPPAGSHALMITEYLSIPQVLKLHHDYAKVVDLVLMVIVAAAIVTSPRKLDITRALLAAGTGYFAFKHVRYAALFMIVAMPLAGRFLSRSSWVRWARISAIVCALALMFIFTRNERQGLARLRTREWVDPVEFPVEAADFIIAENLRGNMYNYYTWGGYLIWRLAPERKVFLDGRNINPDILWEGSMIDSGFELGDQARWKSLLEKHDISYVVVPVQRRGKPVQLVARLARDPGWTAVFKSENSVIFVRKMPRHDLFSTILLTTPR
jgi:hypothetical protein